MIHLKTYDVGIVGGGLAGLALSIQLAAKGYSVIVLEKEQYPFHRVCGEYISMESWDFLESLGVDLEALHPSKITQLQLSSVKGKLLQQQLPLGGFGISRYVLDHTLAKIAVASGVDLEENTKVQDITWAGDGSVIQMDNASYKVRVAVGCFGKRSNIDIKWKRKFVTKAKSRLNNYIGVKYHIESDFADDTIALHCFPGGYCGLVKIDNGRYNLCYLTTADNLRRCNNNMAEMEQTILGKNPHLKKIFSALAADLPSPLTISQVSFDKKKQVEDHVLMVGDAGGMIAPLCGNGMSMAFHGSCIAYECLEAFFEGRISREKMEKLYSGLWKLNFNSRMEMGRSVQRLSFSPMLVNMFITTGKIFPALTRKLIRQTHGKPF